MPGRLDTPVAGTMQAGLLRTSHAKCNKPSPARPRGLVDIALARDQSLASKLSNTSPISAWRPSAFLEKIRSPFTVTSNTPPPLGTSVMLSMLGSNLFNKASVNLTARGV